MATRTASRARSKKKRIPYSKASDDEKVARNWRKSVGLFKREEYSVAIIRCATCVELAVNFAIRQELVTDLKLPLPFVDGLLKSNNGLRNKYYNLYLPIMAEYEEHGALKKLWSTHIENINKQRNDVVHSGQFRTRSTAAKVMTDTHAALIHIMQFYGLGDALESLPE